MCLCDDYLLGKGYSSSFTGSESSAETVCSIKLSQGIFGFEQLANWGVVIEVIRATINCVAFDFVAEPKMWVGLH